LAFLEKAFPNSWNRLALLRRRREGRGRSGLEIGLLSQYRLGLEVVERSGQRWLLRSRL